ncbi:MAG: VTT domain-containing protein, partial [Bryobacteraceae bacterium]
GIPNPGGTDWLLVFMAIARPNDAALCAGMAVLGSLIGTAAFFDVMQRGGEKVLARYTSSERGARFRHWFQRYGLVTVFIPALVPLPFLPFKAFAACAGAMGVNRWRFLGVLAVGRILRYSGLAYLGVKLGTVANSKAWVKAHTWQMVILAVGIFLFFYLLLRFLDREAVQTTN